MNSTLARQTQRIGSGDFSSIDQTFPIRELDETRININKMSEMLHQSQKNHSQFLQDVSHEMRTHIMSISSYAQGMELGIITSHEALPQIQKEGSSLTKIIDKYLIISNVEDPLSAPQLVPIPIQEVTQDCIDRFTAAGLQEGIEIRFESDQAELFALGEESLLTMIIDNLLSNAVRYANREILISVHSAKDGICLRVADDGPGLSEMDLAHLFERGYVGNNGQHGIGLPIALHAAERMGGTLKAENQSEGGALFMLTLLYGKNDEVDSSSTPS